MVDRGFRRQVTASRDELYAQDVRLFWRRNEVPADHCSKTGLTSFFAVSRKVGPRPNASELPLPSRLRKEIRCPSLRDHA
jgi:hypothetical protein